MRKRGELVVAKDAEALARALAERFVAAAQEAHERHGRFDVALAGGSTPKAAYELLAASPLRDRIDWHAVRFFFGDERCVPPDDDASNFKMATAALGSVLTDSGAAIFRMRGEDEPQAAARAYADVLHEELGSDPAFDLVLLGMGPDGHTASLFPGTDPRTDDSALVRAPFVRHLNAYRLTMTPSALCGGRSIIVAVSGTAKADILATVVEGATDLIRYPIQVLQCCSEQLTWFVDRAAAAQLSSPLSLG